MIDPALVTAVGTAIGVLIQSYRSWKKEKVNSALKIDDRLDARLMREFERMESEIQELRSEAASLRLRVAVLEAHISRHNLPLPE